MSETESNVKSFDPEQYRPAADKVKREKQNDGLLIGGLMAALGGIAGYVVSAENEKASRYKIWIGTASAVVAGAVSYILTSKTKSEGEVVYKMAQDAAKQPDPEKAMQDSLKKREQEKEAAMALMAMNQMGADSNANYFQTYTSAGAGGSFSGAGMGRF